MRMCSPYQVTPVFSRFRHGKTALFPCSDPPPLLVVLDIDGLLPSIAVFPVGFVQILSEKEAEFPLQSYLLRWA